MNKQSSKISVFILVHFLAYMFVLPVIEIALKIYRIILLIMKVNVLINSEAIKLVKL